MRAMLRLKQKFRLESAKSMHGLKMYVCMFVVLTQNVTLATRTTMVSIFAKLQDNIFVLLFV